MHSPLFLPLHQKREWPTWTEADNGTRKKPARNKISYKLVYVFKQFFHIISKISGITQKEKSLGHLDLGATKQ